MGQPAPRPSPGVLREILVPSLGQAAVTSPPSNSGEALPGKVGPMLPRAILKDYLRSCSHELLAIKSRNSQASGLGELPGDPSVWLREGPQKLRFSA